MKKKQETVSKTSEEKNCLFNEADAAWDKGDLRQAFTLFMRAAKLGDLSSQLDIGYFFDNGLFVKKDKKQALKWYRKAYLQGDPCGANNIGTVYRDMGETRKMLWWFMRAAAMGHPDALLDLGKRYESGSAVPINLGKAKLFYRRVLSSKHATEDGKAEARNLLTRLGSATSKVVR
jgi:TPR repeat protein